MKKSNYETPIFEIIYFESQDIITTSQLDDFNDGVFLEEDNF